MPKQSTKMSGLQCLATDTVWFDKQRYDEAEKCFYAGASGASTQETEVNAILQDIAKSRQNILQCLNGAKTALLQPKAPAQKRRHRNALVGSPPGGEGRHSVSLTPASNTTQANSCALIVPQSSSHAGDDQELVARMKSVELENHTLHKVVEEMRAALQKLESRVVVLEKSPAAAVTCVKVAPVKQVQVENGDDDDDDVDLFGSDDEEDDEETERLKQERIDAYAAKKSKKPTLIAKSSILLDVKPWDDETDMAKLEECVRSVQMDGLLWGSGKLVAVGYGIKKLQINCVVEDDKVGTDILEEELTKFEDYVQSVDVAAFNKI